MRTPRFPLLWLTVLPSAILPSAHQSVHGAIVPASDSIIDAPAQASASLQAVIPYTENQEHVVPFSTKHFMQFLDQAVAATQTSDIKSSKVSRLAKKFKEEVVGLAKARGVIPPKVVHDRPCAGLCANRTDVLCMSVAKQLNAAITAVRCHRAPITELGLCCCFEAI